MEWALRAYHNPPRRFADDTAHASERTLLRLGDLPLPLAQQALFSFGRVYPAF